MVLSGPRGKRGLRTALLMRRNALSEEEVSAASEAIQARVERLAAFHKAKIIMAYASFRNEVKTEELIKSALEAGKQVAFPVTDIRRKEIYPRFIRRYPEDLETGAYGIQEPKPFCPVAVPEELDLILVPGIAFDPQGFRLGSGEGYYDRFLPRARGISVGLAYSFQLQDTVFPEAHDWPVDFVITEDMTIETAAGAKKRV
ncbi:MAG: 5-formyltetrahydrofolate cyclo-ligase [Firmicutes bacterium]|nr:5-formyltetrahydrofolate cyclo-ligase [Bacillota bacterium]